MEELAADMKATKLAEKQSTPLMEAFSRQGKAIDELHMAIDLLQDKLRPISNSAQTSDRADSRVSTGGNSDVVNAMNEQTDRIFRAASWVQEIKGALEL